MLIITGMGRSGTSVMTRFCHNMGYRTGGNWSSQVDGGMEEPEIVKCNDLLLQGCFKNEVVETIRTFERPVIKDPRFIDPEVLKHWLAIRRDLKFLLLLRRTQDSIASRARHPEWFKGNETEGSLNSKLVEAYRLLSIRQVPVVTLSFPEFLSQYDTVHEILSEFGGLSIQKQMGLRCWNALVDHDKVHVKQDE